tara:strand:- start:41702 stop:42991 length:1290 start_codon:yes stop_codon:yes gene_type:complete
MIKKIIFFLAVIISAQSFSQRSTSSPYSYFGVGEEFGTRTVEQISMGSIGAAYSNNRYLNFTNPASLSELRFATYVFGILNNDLTIKDASSKQSSNSTNLSYFSFAFPVSKKMAVVFGMQPTSSVGYSLINTLNDIEGNPIEITQFSGAGDVNRIYGGFGFKVFKGLSVGMELDFLFGNIQNNVLNVRQDVPLATKNIEDSNIRGGSIKVGTQYKTNITKDLNLYIGASFKLGNSLKSEGTENLYSLSIGTGGFESPRDTISSGPLNGNLERPTETVLGIGLGKTNKWYASVNYKFQDAFVATGYLDNSAQSFQYGESNRISAGGFFIPKSNSISSYLKRVTYRAGLKYEKIGLLVNGTPNSNTFTDINDFGISFGLGLPLGNRLSNVNIGFEYGKKGTTDNGLLEENYFNFRLSLSLNDLWFKKRKID